ADSIPAQGPPRRPAGAHPGRNDSQAQMVFTRAPVSGRLVARLAHGRSALAGGARDDRGALGAFSMSPVTQILERAQQGDPAAAEELIPVVYAELRKIASQKMANELAGYRSGISHTAIQFRRPNCEIIWRIKIIVVPPQLLLPLFSRQARPCGA